MELVTLAHVTLNRIGSASTHGFVRHKEMYIIQEVPDGNLQTLRELVVTIAEENGELRDSLRNMRQENAWHHTQQASSIVFNIQGPTVQYGAPYAVCYSHPALKFGQRYFKLEEVKL
jgi:hypothetical protein